MAGLDKKPPLTAICLLLALVTALLYWPITSHDFVSFDDQEYITENPHVTPGLTWDGIAWAMSAGYASNWHPLTWISHMADCSLYGLHPGGHHLTNLLLHVANTVLLFLLLYQLTGAVWRSACVAALFAWHPVHVESVAWASERKDVLSTLFWILTLIAYSHFKSQISNLRSRQMWYFAALIFFALGLMCKPMLVTLPFVLLLLDFWPLQAASPGHPRAWPRLLVEKIPFFLLAGIASVVTYLVQKHGGAVSSLEVAPLSSRLANALVAYLRYVGKSIWPAHLAAMYPYVKHWPALWVITAAVLVAGLSILFLLRARTSPWLIVGWLWFLGTLVPTIGLVQVGAQSMADRYTYIPGIGLFLLLVWGLDDLLSRIPQRRSIATGLALAVSAACLALTHAQIASWQDSETLFTHAIDVTTGNYTAYNGLGGALDRAGQKDRALQNYIKSVEIDPHYPEGQYNLGTSLMEHGQLDEAVIHLNAALTNNPHYAQAHNNLGKALLRQGRLDEATDHLRQAVALAPGDAESHYNLGTLLLMESHVDDAIAEFTEALRLKPNHIEAHSNLGIALMRLGRIKDGATQFAEALRLDPKSPDAHFNAGLALLQQNQPADAARRFSEALALDPASAKAQYQLATALVRDSKPAEAIPHYRAALKLKADFPDALNDLAWLLCSAPDTQLRDGAEAVRLASQACDLTKHNDAAKLRTLAAAYAEAGQFPEAITTAQQAHDLAAASGRSELAAKSAELVKLFQSGRPFRENF